eukprot:TRINITY_DN524_c0_g1_i4.p1 TRINITY_DN524_c0_g1~~TRINITY_DN524_c0_g1_i4.p1  ORF type:complete len:200 (-),score=40.71 TRINITY_DN524_c0_g1_i4:13-612(-)
MKFGLLFIVLFAVSVLSQTPTKPVWPKAFSTSVEVDEWNGQRRPHFFRWFYDQSQQKDRFDGVTFWLDEAYFSVTIFDHKAGKEWRIFYQREFTTCYQRSINGTLPVPPLDDVEYRGVALIDYQAAYQWRERIPDVGITFEYFDNVISREPVRIDVRDERRGITQTWKFRSFDACIQDSSIFELPQNVQDSCNPASLLH